MNKYLRILTITLNVCLVLSCSTDSQGDTVLKRKNIENTRKTVKRVTYEYVNVFGEYQKKFESMMNRIFDEKGNIIELSYWDSLNNPMNCGSGYHRVIYDIDSLKGESSMTDYSLDGSIHGKSVTKKNDEGNFVVDKFNGDRSLKERTIFLKDKSGNTTETVVYDPKGKETTRYSSKYDESGNEIETRHFFKKKLYLIFKYKYDLNGNKIEGHHLNPDNTLRLRDVWTYDQSDQKRDQHIYNSKDELSSFRTYTYDDSGNSIIDSTFNSEGSLSNITSHTYDSLNRVTSYLYVNYEMKFGKVEEIPSSYIEYLYE